MLRPLRVGFLLIVLAFSGGFLRPTEPTVLMDLGLEELTELSDLIVHGEVVSEEASWNDAHTRIRTRVTLKLKALLRGSVDSQTIAVELPGGLPPGKNLGQLIPGIPKFERGEEAIVFLSLDPSSFCPVVGWTQGKFDVVTEPSTGRKFVIDKLGKARRFREQKAGGDKLRPLAAEEALPIEEFASLISEIQVRQPAAAKGSSAEAAETADEEASVLGVSDEPTATAPSAGYAYSGYKWRDRDLPVSFYVFTGLTPPDSIPMKTYVDAARGAFQKWEDVPSSYMDFFYRGETAAYTPNLDFRDERNVVGWTDENIGAGLAVTGYWFSVLGDYLVEFDMAVRTTIGFGLRWSTATPIPFASYDLHSTLLHEAGHALSLDDLTDRAYSGHVMFYSLTNGETKRTLQEGDVAGISFIYPKDGDLVVSDVQGPSSALEHQSIEVRATVKNSGARAIGSCLLGFYLALNSGIGPKDILLGSARVPSLNPGQKHEATLSVSVPSVVAERNYYLCAVADADGQVAEASEDNNTNSYFPLNVRFDKDADGLPNWWEIEVSLNPNDATGDNGASGDPDADGFLNSEEYQRGTNPQLADSDGDGQNDRDEVLAGTDPTDETSNFRVEHVRIGTEGSDRWVGLFWTTVSGKMYQVYYQDEPGGDWLPLGSAHGGTGWLLGFNDLDGLSSPTRLYRVGVQ